MIKKCNCKRDLNLSAADIQLKKNQINITITREPDSPLISELRAQIQELREIGLEFQDLDRKIRDVFSELDVVSKTMLLELLEDYVKKSDTEALKTELKTWADQRFLRKIFLTQEAYDALQTYEENVLYCII